MFKSEAANIDQWMCPSPSPAAAPTVKLSIVKLNVAEPPSVVAVTDIAGSVGAASTHTSSIKTPYPYPEVALKAM